MALPLPLFPGLEPPSVFSNNVDFSLLLQTSSASLVPASGMDLTVGMNLVDLSAGMVLTNILSKLRIRSDRFYAIVKVVGPCLILAAGTFEFGRHLSFIPIGLRAIGSKLVSCFTASITIPATPSLNDDVCSWVAAQGSGMNSKSLTLCPPKSLDFWQLEQEADILKPLNYTSSFGDSTFLYKGYQMTLTRIEPTTTEGRDGPMKVAPGEIDPTESQNIKLSCFPTFRGAEPIKDFLNHVRGFAKPDLEGLTNIYHHVKSGPSHFWESVTRPSRALEGVVMESKAKDALVADIDFYLSNECRMYYENRGIPYRRGFLLYGPPGTGKTSFATAIAGHFKLPVYILNLTDLDDKGLE